MRGTLQYRFTTARVQWPCSTDIHWACLITQSGPARYVTNRRLAVRIERPKVENKLRVRECILRKFPAHAMHTTDRPRELATYLKRGLHTRTPNRVGNGHVEIDTKVVPIITLFFY